MDITQSSIQNSSPVEWHKEKKWIKLKIIVAVIILLIGAYFLMHARKSKPSLDTVSKDSESTIALKWELYKNDEIDVSFKYPPAWEPIITNDVLCLADKKEPENQPCLLTSLSPTIASKPFFAAPSKLFLQFGSLQNDYWGDRFAQIAKQGEITAEKIKTMFCPTKANTCEEKTNRNSITYIKSNEAQQTKESTKQAYYYYVFMKNSNFPIIIFTTQSFSNTISQEDAVKIFDRMLSTVTIAKQNDTTAGEELYDFPLYKGARFVKKETAPQCGKPTITPALCNAITYTWETTEDGNKVASFYKEGKSTSGWTCSAGMGGPNVLTCRKGNVQYTLFLETPPGKTTISLVKNL